MGRFLEKLARGERAKLRMLRDQLEKAKRAPELRGVGKTVYIWNITQAIDALENRMDKDKDKKEKLARGERAKLRMLRDQLEKAKRAPDIRDITQAIDALENRMDKDKDKKEKRKQERAEKKDRVPTPETYPL